MAKDINEWIVFHALVTLIEFLLLVSVDLDQFSKDLLHDITNLFC